MDLLKYRRNILPDHSKLLVSVSGGKTSMFLAQFIKNAPAFKGIHKIFVFANTGLEREETLEFIERCDNYFGLDVIWVEADIRPQKGKGTSYKITNFKNAKRSGEPFGIMINKYGLPNKNFLHCTRVLKTEPINKVKKALFGHGVYTAVGIRNDERNRINRKNAKKIRYIYPLVDVFPVNKEFINSWWDAQPFNLGLEEHEGNCDFCWKKSLKKRLRLLRENPTVADIWEKWELKSPYNFDRDDYTIGELKEMAKMGEQELKDYHRKKTGSQKFTGGASCLCGE